MSATLTVLIVLVLVVPLVLQFLRRRGRDLGVVGEALQGSDEEDQLERASAATGTGVNSGSSGAQTGAGGLTPVGEAAKGLPGSGDTPDPQTVGGPPTIRGRGTDRP